MITIEKSDSIHPDYSGLIRSIYGHTAEAERFIHDSNCGLEALITNRVSCVFFHLLDNRQLLGQIGLICISKKIAYFGFFETIETNRFMELWHSLLNEAKIKGIEKLFGPVNGTIWHPYRLISETSPEPFFAHEPLSSIAYYNLFNTNGPVDVIEFYSAYRTKYELIIGHTENSINILNETAVTIVQEDYSPTALKEIYELSIAIFSQSPGFYTLSFSDFAKLYTDVSDKCSQTLIFKVLHNNKVVGFSYNILSDKNLIMKTIGLLPNWQEKGIGNALVYTVHKYAYDNHLEKVIYALIRKDNKVKNFPKDDAYIFRRYAAFSFSVI